MDQMSFHKHAVLQKKKKKKKKRGKFKRKDIIKNTALGVSLVAQWLRIRLPMQGTRVRALVQEDPTCRRATKPVRHNHWACVSLRATTTEARVPRARALQKEKPPRWEARALQQRVAPAHPN